MSDQQTPPHAAPPQFSADGQWWWDGHRWVPAQQAKRSSGTKIVLGVVAAVVGVLVLMVAFFFWTFSAPIGTQHDTDELGDDYCKVFPEDC